MVVNSIGFESEDGSTILIKHGSSILFGRGLGFASEDRTVSRRHISFEVHSSDEKDQKEINPVPETRVSFEALGKNPTWIVRCNSEDINTFSKFDKGEMRIGDRFCISSRNPTLFTLKRIGFKKEERDKSKALVQRESISENEKEILDRIRSGDEGSKGDEDLGFQDFDISNIDPVKEFGFLLMGHEFDHYPKQMIRSIKNWNWFLEEPSEESEDDDESLKRSKSKGGKGMRRKKKGEGNDDENWTGESEDDEVMIQKLKRDKRPKYSTRSKDFKKPNKDTGGTKNSVQKKKLKADEEYDDVDEDEDEDNLGGFIVDDEMEEVEDEEETEDEVEEEEEEDYSDDEDE